MKKLFFVFFCLFSLKISAQNTPPQYQDSFEQIEALQKQMMSRLNQLFDRDSGTFIAPFAFDTVLRHSFDIDTSFNQMFTFDDFLNPNDTTMSPFQGFRFDDTRDFSEIMRKMQEMMQGLNLDMPNAPLPNAPKKRRPNTEKPKKDYETEDL